MKVKTALAISSFTAITFAAMISCKSTDLKFASQQRRPAQINNAPYVLEINSIEDFNEMGKVSQGLIKNGRSVKFLVDLRNGTAKTHFINGNHLQGASNPEFVRYHYFFAQAILGYQKDGAHFNSATYFPETRADREFVAGTLQTFKLEDQQYLSIHFYPQDLISEEDLAFAVKEVFSKVHIDGIPKAFIQLGGHQTVEKPAVAATLASIGVKPFTLSEVAAGQKMVIMNKGKSIGILRIMPPKSDVNALSEMDIALFEELPLDLTVVAGTITTAPQDVGSHINLKSQERKTPNVVDLEAVSRWKSLDGKAVEMEVIPGDDNSEGSYTLKRIGEDVGGKDTGAEIVTAYYTKLRKDRDWMDLKPQQQGTVATDFVEMCPTSAKKCLDLIPIYGGKAAKLGFLANKKVIGKGGEFQGTFGYRINPLGFGIPLRIYFETLKANPQLKQKIQAVIDSEMGLKPLLTPLKKAEALKDIRESFYLAKLPTAEIQALRTQLKKLSATVLSEFGVTLNNVKIRSSSNAEDLPDFDGAGLHDSYKADAVKEMKPEQVCRLVADEDKPAEGDEPGEEVSTKLTMKPKTLECALLGVYASLWNKRAVEERSFKGINHNTVGMGIAVNPTYNFLETKQLVEVGNGVVISKVLSAANIYGYTYTIQDGENLATNPNPGTQAEITLANFLTPNEPITFSTLNFAKPKKNLPTLTKKVLSDEMMKDIVRITQHIEMQYCYAKSDYYDGNCADVTWDPRKTKALDMEFKILGYGTEKKEIVFKQTREFSGIGPGFTE